MPRSGQFPLKQRRNFTTLDQWEPIPTTPCCCFVNLQHGENQAEVLHVLSRLGMKIGDWPGVNPIVELEAFAALIAVLDPAISVHNVF